MQPPPPHQPTLALHQQPLGEIQVISRGFAGGGGGGGGGGGESSSARKAHLRSIKSGETFEIQAVSKLPQMDTTITFSNSDMEGYQHLYDDPLVMRVVVANKTIPHGPCRQWKLGRHHLHISFRQNRHWKGEARTSQHLPTWILRRKSATSRVNTTSAHFGRPPWQATTIVRFLIVDALSAYNMLLGRPSLNTIRAIPSSYHMVVKFPTANGVGMV